MIKSKSKPKSRPIKGKKLPSYFFTEMAVLKVMMDHPDGIDKDALVDAVIEMSKTDPRLKKEMDDNNEVYAADAAAATGDRGMFDDDNYF